MRRRALLAASAASREESEDLPPESTTFEFPLYLNTKIIEKTSDFLYRSRDYDEIHRQLHNFYRDNSSGVSGGSVGNPNWPRNFFEDYPVFIDGYQVEDIDIRDGDTFYGFKTNKDYGDYADIEIYLDGYELWVEGYN
jgi:hypothetical protein